MKTRLNLLSFSLLALASTTLCSCVTIEPDFSGGGSETIGPPKVPTSMRITRVQVESFPSHKRTQIPKLHWDGPGLGGAHKPDLMLKGTGAIFSPSVVKNADFTSQYSFSAVNSRPVSFEGSSCRIQLFDQDKSTHDSMGTISFSPEELYRHDGAYRSSHPLGSGDFRITLYVEWQYGDRRR